MNSIEKNLLAQIADLHEVPMGAYNIREDGKLHSRNTTKNIDIISKTDKQGIEIRIKPGTKNESVHIPVIITKTGHTELVYNDFFIGENSDVLIVAGCGIHNSGCETSRHDGVHTFYLGKNSRIKYVEKHYGEGEGTGEKVMNPQTVVYMEPGSYIEMETVQIKGVDSTKRHTKIEAGEGCEIVIIEKLMTHDRQSAVSEMDINLNGDGSKARVISRSVAQDDSEQTFYPSVTGNAQCFGHVQCDSIIMQNAKVRSIPAINAFHVNAQLIHEAAIGKIAGDQLLKLMTLGLSEEEAEERILSGFLK
ncbi:MAG: SufD family Fe-S cluster assembly protein [Clostridiales bacterium]|mgnify:CR=1 FL=1|jgi:Fe-S cluster assembly scaffold protein SufB|nr:SufD family Fe-S cluster assembly protein [Clostridiales bacterium]